MLNFVYFLNGFRSINLQVPDLQPKLEIVNFSKIIINIWFKWFRFELEI